MRGRAAVWGVSTAWMLLPLIGCQAVPFASHSMVPTQTTVDSGTKASRTEKPVSPAPSVDTRPAPPVLIPVETPPELPPAVERPKALAVAATQEVELPPASFLKPASSEPDHTQAEIQAIVLGHQEPKVAPPPEKPPTLPGVVAAPKVDKQVVPVAVEAVTPPRSPDQIWREGLEQLRSVARQKAKSGNNGTDPWNFRSRLLGWLGEPAIDPDFGSADQEANWRAFLKGLQVIASTSSENKLTKAEGRSTEIREAVRALEDYAPLEMTDLALSRRVNGFGDYETLDPPHRKAGQSVVLYAELEGLTFEPAEKGYRSRLASRVEILAPNNSTPVWSMALGTAEDRCRRKRRDFYINNRFTLPETLKPGNYIVRSLQSDLISGKTVSRDVPLVIQP